MWDQAEFSIPELVDMAVACIDKEADDWRISGSDNTTRFRHLMPILIEKLAEDSQLSAHEYNISEQGLRGELRSFLNDIKHEDEPGRYFEQNIGDLHQQLGTTEPTQYTIGFPLNLRLRSQRQQDTFRSLGHKIERMGRNEWLSEFKERAETAEQEDDQGHGDDRFTDFMEQVPNDFSWANNTFWKFELDARDEQFVIDRLERVLGYLLGKINVAAYAGSQEGFSSSPSVWQSGWSDLRHPFIYIVFEEDLYSQFYYETDISPRDKFRVHSARASMFDISIDNFPGVEYPLDSLEERFVETVRRFQAAITEADREESFLEYWRGIEALTLTGDDEGMDTVIRRAEAPLEHTDHTFFRYRLKRARYKRNQLVHDGVDISVTRHDQNLLKRILEELIWLYCGNLDRWDADDFRFYLENVGQEPGMLAETKQNFERKTELIGDILKAKQYEESIFERILRDWAEGRNRLDDAEFTDPFGFFYPIFGIGDDDAAIMVIADTPTYPVGDDEELQRRSQVRGWRPNTTAWESVDQYREFCSELIEQANPDGTQDILEAVASAVDQNPDELYFTTLQKDGAFDESLDETEDSKDPAKLNESSRAAWAPYLEDEIDHVDPDLIILFGERTLQILLDSYGRPDTPIEDVPYGELYVIDKYPILRFDYWSSIDPPNGNDLETHIEEIVACEWKKTDF